MNRDQRQTTRFKSDYAAQLAAAAEREPRYTWRPLTVVLVRPDDAKRIADFRNIKSLVK